MAAISSATQSTFQSTSSISQPSQALTLEALKEMLPNAPYVIEASLVEKIKARFGCTTEKLLEQLILIAKSYALPQISDFQVGAAALGSSGNIYLGVNVEFLGVPLNETIHAEQFLIANARAQGEEQITHLMVTSEPCGHCRQFLNEMEKEKNARMDILTPNSAPEKLASLLPKDFGPSDLGISGGLLARRMRPALPVELDTMSMAIRGLALGYYPYSSYGSGVGLQTKSMKYFAGSYLENAAFNPSLSPFQDAVIQLLAAGLQLEDIDQVVLLEMKDAKISHASGTEAILKKNAPSAKFQLTTF